MAHRHGRKQFKLRFNGEVVFKRGQINIIVGPTASGKVWDDLLTIRATIYITRYSRLLH